MVFDEARGLAEEDGQHAARERVERAAVPDALRRGQTPDEPDDVVGGRPDRLRDDEDAVEIRRARVAFQRVTSATIRSASARTARRASATGAAIVAPDARA